MTIKYHSNQTIKYQLTSGIHPDPPTTTTKKETLRSPFRHSSEASQVIRLKSLTAFYILFVRHSVSICEVVLFVFIVFFLFSLQKISLYSKWGRVTESVRVIISMFSGVYRLYSTVSADTPVWHRWSYSRHTKPRSKRGLIKQENVSLHYANCLPNHNPHSGRNPRSLLKGSITTTVKE